LAAFFSHYFILHLDTLFVSVFKRFAFFYLTNFCEGIYDKFANALLDAVQSMKVGDGFSEGVAQVGIFLNLIIRFIFSL
jgi:hypothetical protein